MSSEINTFFNLAPAGFLNPSQKCRTKTFREEGCVLSLLPGNIRWHWTRRTEYKKYGSEFKSKDQWALCQQTSWATPSLGEKGIWVLHHKIKKKKSSWQIFFLLVQKPCTRNMETIANLEEIHPEKKFSNKTNQCCFSGHVRVFPYWVM